MGLKRYLLAAVFLFALACANPNRRNGATYDGCDFLRVMEVHRLGIQDCEDR